jgi:hypothetical protein
MVVKKGFDDSARQLIPGSAINTLTPSAKIIGSETKLTLRERSLTYQQVHGMTTDGLRIGNWSY